ncbi:glycoside hydrolase family 43 protein [Isoptericola sp. S6320L]|uniref:glycoside hydrolase family 43 protein n=1 Tax=Isoptericola sp. S6320L TaxID=2926411 RepID=UPI001FF348BC|nr:glycoside hydrolase family 43 protein [Isoptericola sp. S6320L]MCK0118126.1 glycoside hydrolase family 43 protein [Isoptericola sp. S6320L]
MSAVVVGLAACSGGATGAEGAADDSGSAAAPWRPEPLISQDFPDPDVLVTDDGYVAYATNGPHTNVRVATSDDLVTWEQHDDAMPDLPPWVIPGRTWAPEVTRADDGTYVLYFTAASAEHGVQCLGAATSDGPLGPFEAVGDGMLVCPEAEGGAIDAATFEDGGTTYLLWKNDGNCCGHDTWIQAAPLTADGLSLAGDPVRLFRQDQAWEGDLVEAPTIVRRDGTYHAFYSASFYGDDSYAVGHATAPSLTGPWTKDPEPLLSTVGSGGMYRGPGGQDVVPTPDGEMFLFHAWDGAYVERELYGVPLVWEAGRPVLELPTPPR